MLKSVWCSKEYNNVHLYMVLTKLDRTIGGGKDKKTLMQNEHLIFKNMRKKGTDQLKTKPTVLLQNQQTSMQNERSPMQNQQ